MASRSDTISQTSFKIARQPCYRWRSCPVAKAELGEAYLANALFTAPKDGPEFGYRFHADEVRDAGHSVADRTVWRICSEHGWWSVVGRSAARTASRALPPHDDLAQRDFTAEAANQPTPTASD
jgi:hypothetical protein